MTAQPVPSPSPEQQREATASRLIRSSQATWFDPHTEVDWQRPLDDGRWFNSPEQSTLYGTALWDGLTRQQRIELSKHEFASVAETGIWFELILMKMLMSHAYELDPRSSHLQYALVETADECRHSQMFARFLEVSGVPRYGPGRLTHLLGRVMHTPLVNDAIAFGGTLYVEGVLDALQRTVMADDRAHPIAREICRIHVIEEARHMRYAEEEMARIADDLGTAARAWTKVFLLLVAERATDALVHPRVYESVGLDIEDAVAAARNNPHWQRTRQWAARRPLRAFERAGLLDGPGVRAAWRRIGLLPGDGGVAPPVSS